MHNWQSKGRQAMPPSSGGSTAQDAWIITSDASAAVFSVVRLIATLLGMLSRIPTVVCRGASCSRSQSPAAASLCFRSTDACHPDCGRRSESWLRDLFADRRCDMTRREGCRGGERQTEARDSGSPSDADPDHLVFARRKKRNANSEIRTSTSSR